MKRITWIDNFKFFCIFAVMAEHTEMLTGLTDSLNATFYVSGFFFASGYLYKHRDGFSAFLVKKVKQLLVPWFVFSMFIIISSHILSFGKHNEGIGTAVLNNLLQIRYHGDEMWFVAALFVSFIPLYFLIKWIEKEEKNRKTKTVIAAVVLLGLSVFNYLLSDTGVIGGTWHQYPWHLEYIFRGSFLMLLGYIFRHYGEEKLDKINTVLFRVGIFVLLFAVTWGTQLTHHVFSTLDAAIYKYVSSAIGITAFIVLSKVIKPNRYMSFLGKNSVAFYGLHGKVESIIHYLLSKFIGEPYWALCYSFTDRHSLLFGATFTSYFEAFIVSLILIIPVLILEKYLPFVMGKSSSAKTAK